MNHATRRIAAEILFVAGVLITLVLTALMAWAPFEGLSYFASGAGYDSFSGLHCPILISSTEAGQVRAEFRNSTDEVQQPYYEVEISGKVASRHLESQVSVPAQTIRVVRWTVSSEDVDLEPFIFVKLDVLPIGEYATREATCGIVVAGLGGLSGATALAVAIALGLISMLAGLMLPALGLNPVEAVRFDRDAGTNRRRASQALAVAATVGLLAGLMGWWLIALVLLAIGVLLALMAIAATISGGASS